MIFLFLAPILVSLCFILFFKKSGQTSGLFGVVCAILMAFTIPELNISTSIINKTLLNTFVLSLSALCVILPGITMASILENGGYNAKVREFLDKTPIPTSQKILILIFGLLPAIESITGFGISLILAVPLFFGLFEQRTAEKLSMLSMNIMPWGTLGLATLVGSQISGYTIAELGLKSSYFILPIFLLLSNVTLYLIKTKSYSFRDFFFTSALSSLFCVILYTFNWLQLVEIAGVVAGMATFFILFCFFILQNKSSLFQEIKNLLKATIPYLLIIIFIIINKIFLWLFPLLSSLSTIHGYGVKFSLASSPLFAISLAVLCLAYHKKINIEVPVTKAYKACSVLFIFIFLAQFMNFSGFIQNMAIHINSQNSDFFIKFTSPMFAMLSGFITGSNLGGNALLMGIQKNLGESIGGPLLLSAIQNVGSGYAVFASMPIIILIKTIADNSVRVKVDGQRMLNFGLQCMMGIYLILLAITYLS